MTPTMKTMANSPRALVEEEKEEEKEKVTANAKPRVAEEEGRVMEEVMEEVMEGVVGETGASWVSCAASVAYARDVERKGTECIICGRAT